jgi:hypothetical protein
MPTLAALLELTHPLAHSVAHRGVEKHSSPPAVVIAAIGTT